MIKLKQALPNGKPVSEWSGRTIRHLWRLGFCTALIAGVVFRTLWVQDVEYKGDEAWTFEQVRAFWTTHNLPLIRMISSVGLPNAGVSLWVFIALGALVPLDSPLGLSRAVQMRWFHSNSCSNTL